MIPCGRAIFPIICATCSRSSSAIASSPTYSDFRVTKATMASPTRSSGFDTTAASATLGSSTSALSISYVESRWPATFMTSSILPRSQKYPSSSRLAPSPAT